MKEKTSSHLQSVLLSAIDRGDDSSRMTYCPDLEGLKVSMEARGLFNPVILRGKEDFQVVAGYRRILVATSLGWKTIPARVFTPEDLDIEESFRLNFYENLGTREFNLVEAAMVVSGFLDKCKMDSTQVREKILPLLGFQSGAAVLGELHSLLRLIDPWKELVVRDEIALPNAAKIAAFPSLEQKILFEALSGLKLGHNKMRHCMEMIAEICRRDEIPVVQLFAAKPFRELTQNEKRNTTAKTEMFRRELRKIRYPQLTRCEEEFQDARRKLSLPPSISMEPPEFFEGEKVKVTFSFRTPEELRTILKKLQEAASSEALHDMLGRI